jgi:hypothetical protein
VDHGIESANETVVEEAFYPLERDHCAGENVGGHEAPYEETPICQQTRLALPQTIHRLPDGACGRLQ